MKKILTITAILTWINLLTGAMLLLVAFLTMVLTGVTAMLIPIVLIGCIVLHSYAAMQLRRSILWPSIPLNKQTPVGIRIMGFLSMFFAILLISNAIFILQNPKEFIGQVQLPVQLKEVDISKTIHGTAIFMLVLGSSIILNIILNFRLLRWYILYTSQQGPDK